MGAEIVRQQPQQALSLQDQLSYANAVCRADIIPQAYKGKPANIIVAVGFGQSIGLSPTESMYRINVIGGKPTMSAELIASMVRKAGHKLRLAKDEAGMSATCTIIRCDDPEAPFTVTRDAKWAQQMGLSGKDNYKKQPLTMLTWRAITACAREACPEALFGVMYTPDEMEDMEPPQTPKRVEAVKVEPVVEPEPADLSPVRDRMEAYSMAVHPDMADRRERMAATTADLLAAANATDMHALSRSQVRHLTEVMDEAIAQVERAEPVILDYEEEF